MPAIETQDHLKMNEKSKDLLVSAMEFLKAGRMADAADTAERARQHGQSGPVLLVFAAISHKMGRDGDALLMLEQAMQLEPSIGNYPEAAAAILLKVGQKADGLYYLKLGTHLEKDDFLNTLMNDFFGDIKSIFDGFIENKPLKVAQLMIDQQLYSSAYQQLENYISMTGGSAESFSLIAKCAVNLGQIQSADIALKAARSLNDKYPGLSDLEFELACLRGDKAEVRICLDSLPPPATLKQAENRYQLIVSSPLLEESDVVAALGDVISRIEAIPGIESAEFVANSEESVLGFLISSFDTQLEALLTLLCEKIKIKIYYAGSDNSPAKQRLMAAIEDWRDIAGIDDEILVDMIRFDNLSVFFDCVGVGALSRLPLLRSRVAPIQVLWRLDNGFDDSTLYDFYLSDVTLDNSELDERRLCLSNPLRLPLPPTEFMGRVMELRELVVTREKAASGAIRFFAPHSQSNLTEAQLQVWSALLREIPDATLSIIEKSDVSSEVIQRILSVIADEDVIGRIDLIDPEQFSKMRHEIIVDSDLILDSFPRGNYFATQEVLWIGCPIVSLAGKKSYERSSASLLLSVGMDELVGHTVEEYKSIVKDLALNVEKRTAITQKLKMVTGELTLAAYDAAAVELVEKSNALWRNWCSMQD